MFSHSHLVSNTMVGSRRARFKATSSHQLNNLGDRIDSLFGESVHNGSQIVLMAVCYAVRDLNRLYVAGGRWKRSQLDMLSAHWCFFGRGDQERLRFCHFVSSTSR